MIKNDKEQQSIKGRVKNTITILTALILTVGGSSLLFNKNLSTVIPTVHADSAYFNLSTGNFSQNWTNTGLITTDDDWSGVPSIVGYRGDGLTGSTGTDPQTIVAESIVVDVNANQTNSNTFVTGGVTEFEITNPTIGLLGSGTADAPYIQLFLDTTGRQTVTVSYNLRDIDGSADDAMQQVALQYRVGTTGNFTNVPAGYVADATTGPSLATLVTPVSVQLPAAVENQAQVQVRIITSNAPGNDEYVGVDDILVTSVAPTAASATISGRATNSSGRGLSFVTVLLTGGSLTEPKYAMTNSSGYYNFADVAVGEGYVVSVKSKRYVFRQPSVFVGVNQNLTGVDFIGELRR